jgi:hypothetical protein
MLLMEYSENGVRKAIKTGRWPAHREGDHYLISPDILIERWALELTHGMLGPITRDRLAALALAANYSLDMDALQRDCARAIQQEAPNRRRRS